MVLNAEKPGEKRGRVAVSMGVWRLGALPRAAVTKYH